MLQGSCECDVNTLSMIQLNVLEAIGYIRNISKQRPDFDALCKLTSRSEASNIYKTTAENIMGALIDRNVIINRQTKLDQTSNFHRREESIKSVATSLEKTCAEFNLPVTSSSNTATPLDVLDT